MATEPARIDSRERVKALAAQLSAPQYRPVWSEAGDTVQIESHGTARHHVLVAPIAISAETSPGFRMAWHTRPERVPLTPLTADHHHTVAVGGASGEATHYWVLIWSPLGRPLRPIRVRTLFNAPFEIELQATATATTLEALGVTAPLDTEPALEAALESVDERILAMALKSLWQPDGRPYGHSGLIAINRHPSPQARPVHKAGDAAPVPLAEPPQQSATRFAFASCQYPAGVFDVVPARASFDRLEAAVATAVQTRPVEAVLFLGDQIYADASYGLIDPAGSLDHFRQSHEAWREAVDRRTHVGALLQRNRVHAIPDDHEIHDNWEPQRERGAEGTSRQVMNEALAAFDATVGRVVQPKRSPQGGYWGRVSIGGRHEAFMLDTRTQRDRRGWGPGDLPDAPHILHKPQRDALEAWLNEQLLADDKAGGTRPKFISCGLWPLPRRVGRQADPAMTDAAAARSDSWDGYPASLKWLLGYIARQHIRGVVILCGDAHLAGYTKVRVGVDGHHTTLRILHCSALYAPFPFANGQPHHYRRNDHLAWDDGGVPITVDVRSKLRPWGDGFVQVDVQPATGGWTVSAHFNTAPEAGPTLSWTVA